MAFFYETTVVDLLREIVKYQKLILVEIKKLNSHDENLERRKKDERTFK